MGAGGYVCLALALLGLGFGLYHWYRGRRTLRRLDEILSAAVDGSFRENAFDESVPSALEAKLARFLNGSAASARGHPKSGAGAGGRPDADLRHLPPDQDSHCQYPALRLPAGRGGPASGAGGAGRRTGPAGGKAVLPHSDLSEGVPSGNGHLRHGPTGPWRPAAAGRGSDPGAA